MATKRAKTLEDSLFRELMASLNETSRRPVVDRAVFLLSFKAGLRAQEIAGLEWRRHLLDAKGAFHTVRQSMRVGKKSKKVDVGRLFISSDIGKYGQERTLSINSLLFEALRELRQQDYPGQFVIPPARSTADPSLKSRAHALTTRINRLYDEMGFEGCSSHSGRRTLLTKASRSDMLVGHGLKTVQMIAGHANLASTEAYLDVSDDTASLLESL